MANTFTFTTLECVISHHKLRDMAQTAVPDSAAVAPCLLAGALQAEQNKRVPSRVLKNSNVSRFGIRGALWDSARWATLQALAKFRSGVLQHTRRYYNFYEESDFSSGIRTSQRRIGVRSELVV